MVRAIILLAALLLAVPGWLPTASADSLHNEETGAATRHSRPDAKKPARPKPPKVDKEKNCQWGHDVDIDLDTGHIRVSQFELKRILSGAESQIHGYRLSADTERMVLYIQQPDGSWYVADLMRLGSLDEGCVFFYVDPATPLEGEPPL